MHYKKVLALKWRIAGHILIALATIGLTIFAYSLEHDWHWGVAVTLITADLISPLCDICLKIKEEKSAIADDIPSHDSDIEFSDRVELTDSLLQDIETAFASSQKQVRQYLPYRDHNGKTRFAIHLCEKLQTIRNDRTGNIQYPSIHKHVGNICMLQSPSARELQDALLSLPS